MAADSIRQMVTGALVASVAAVFLATVTYLDRPAPGEFVEVLPGAYVLFKQVLHGAILAFLLFWLVVLPGKLAGRPVLRLVMLVVTLVGAVAAALVLAIDFNLI